MGDPRSTAFESGTAPDRSAAATGNDRDAPIRDASDDAVGPFEAPDPAAERERIRTFIDDRVAAANAAGLVVNMSGGLDSTVTAALAVEALGADRVYGLILPCNKIGAPHARDAEALADALGIEHDTVHLRSGSNTTRSTSSRCSRSSARSRPTGSTSTTSRSAPGTRSRASG